jgi:hypothetical protein
MLNNGLKCVQKAFKDWFGDWENNPEEASKTVDENGEPMVVNHATYSDFNEFDKSYFGENTDFNASDEDFMKTAHIGFWFDHGGDLSSYGATRTVKAYLSVKNPIRFDSLEKLASELSGYDTAEDFVSEAERNGYDGVVINDEEFGGTSYVAFEPNQIKSATENNGEFSSVSNDIRFRTAEEGVERENARLIQPWSEPLDALRAKRDVRKEKLNTWEKGQLKDLERQEKEWEEKYQTEHTDTPTKHGRATLSQYYADAYGQGGMSQEIRQAQKEVGPIYNDRGELMAKTRVLHRNQQQTLEFVA